MYGVLVNAAVIVAGGMLGLLLRGGISKRFESIIEHALALCVFIIGVSGAIKTHDMMLVIVCLVLGSLIGEALRIEAGLEWLGAKAEQRFSKGDSGFAQGFITATLLFCVGAMAVVGSLEAGLSNKADTLLAKSAIDGVSSIIFASSMGAGVMLSALPILVYQGGIALLSGSIQQFLAPEVICEMSAVGSMLIIALSFNMFGLTKERVRVGNMLPAMLLPILYIPLMNLITQAISR